MKYNTIIQCDLADFRYGKIEYKNCYLLSYNGCSEELEIELTGNFWFNTEFKAVHRKKVARVENAIDLLNFMIHNNIFTQHNEEIFKEVLHTRKYDFNNLDNSRLYVGGCRDYILDYNLNVLGWKEEFENEK